MFESKYSKVLTIILVIVIVAIVLELSYYNKVVFFINYTEIMKQLKDRIDKIKE